MRQHLENYSMSTWIEELIDNLLSDSAKDYCYEEVQIIKQCAKTGVRILFKGCIYQKWVDGE